MASSSTRRSSRCALLVLPELDAVGERRDHRHRWPVEHGVVQRRNSNALFASSNNAFDNLAGKSSQGFGWGLPFFYGKRIYTAIAARNTSAGQGPYYAF
jgi:hypothetical protein